MKKLILFTLILALALSLAACGSKAEPAPADVPADSPAEAPEAVPEAESNESSEEAPFIPAMPNPMTSYESVEEINEIIGCRLCTPGVMGVSDKAYLVIETSAWKMAEVQFTVAGLKYSFRSAPVADHDISGLWMGENGTAFEGMEISDELQYAEDSSFKAARWFTMDGQYVLSVTDEGSMEKDTFLGIAEELRARTQPGMSEGEYAAFYAGLEGNYADTVSQRAMAEVTANGGEGVTIVVKWGSSASKTDQWKMEARRTEDGLLSYPGEEHSLFVTEADGTVNQMMADAAMVPGWFAVSEDGHLEWTGANDEQCRTCIFEKVELSGDPLAPAE